MDRQVGRLLALENSADIDARQAIHVSQTAAIAHQPAGRDKLTKLEHRRHRLAQRQGGKPGTATDEEWIGPNYESARVHSSQDRENRFEIAFAASRTCSCSPSERAAACESRDRASALGLVGLTRSATSVAVGLS